MSIRLLVAIACALAFTGCTQPHGPVAAPAASEAAPTGDPWARSAAFTGSVDEGLGGVVVTVNPSDCKTETFSVPPGTAHLDVTLTQQTLNQTAPGGGRVAMSVRTSDDAQRVDAIPDSTGTATAAFEAPRAGAGWQIHIVPFGAAVHQAFDVAVQLHGQGPAPADIVFSCA